MRKESAHNSIDTWPTPQEIDFAFSKLISEAKTRKGWSHERAAKIHQAFSDSNYGPISADKLAAQFSELVNPRKSAIDALNWISKRLKKHGLKIERQTYYYFTHTEKEKKNELPLPDRVTDALQIAQKRLPKKNWGKSRRKFDRYARIATVFHGRENQLVSLRELAEQFEDNNDPSKATNMAVVSLNKKLNEIGLQLNKVSLYQIIRSFE